MPKPIEQFLAPDERLLNTVTKHDREAGILYLGRYPDLYEHIAEISLGDALPAEVHAQWDLALNLYLPKSPGEQIMLDYLWKIHKYRIKICHKG